MSQRGVDAADRYHDLLASDPDEFRQFIELMTVNETYFFRESHHLEMLVDYVVPQILAERKTGPIRIVSVGCSTGEEPYSIAIKLQERFGEDSGRLFQIVGTDIDSSVIAKAKHATYGKNSFRNMDETILERYFKPSGPGTYQLDKTRNLVSFERVNLKDAFYPVLIQQADVIFYRNVSIYFPSLVQREIFGRLALLLRNGGHLFVGTTETMQHDIGILTLENRGSVFFYRKIAGAKTDEIRTVKPEPAERLQKKPESFRRPLNGDIPTSPIAQARTCMGTSGPKSATSANSSAVKKQFDDAFQMAISSRLDEALALLDAIIEQDSSFTRAHSLKGSIYMSKSRFQEAVALCNTILSRDPLCLEAYLMLGVTARHAGDDEDAQRRFREALYLKSSCWLAHFYMAEILFVQGDKNRARSGYEAALRVLEEGSSLKRQDEFFPLSFNAEQFMTICRHKLSLLKNG
jgi:chemotaxis protein methyltransferase CheR